MTFSLKGWILKKIVKTIESENLTRYRSTIARENLEDSNIYDDYPDKTREDCANNIPENLRKQLLEEQGSICCYCMSRISCHHSKIEHFKPQTEYRNLQINYQNLFIACSGGEGLKEKNQFCDTKKGENELVGIDLLSNIENQITYHKKSQAVEIESTNSNISQDIKTLNLNLLHLQKNRKEAYDNSIKNLKRKGYSIQAIKKFISSYQTKHGGKFEPYCQMIIYFLIKKLKSKGITI